MKQPFIFKAQKLYRLHKTILEYDTTLLVILIIILYNIKVLYNTIKAFTRSYIAIRETRTG